MTVSKVEMETSMMQHLAPAWTLPLSEAPKAYKMMAERLDGAIKIVLKP